VQRNLKIRGQGLNSSTVKLSVFPFFFLALCMASCATVFNNATHRVTIRTNLKADSIAVDSMKISFSYGEAKLHVTRDQKPLTIKIKGKDSLNTVQIKSRNSFNYVTGAAVTAGINILIERANPKRYYYQKNIYISQNDKGISIFRFAPTPKGSIRVHLSFPYLNYFYIATNNDHRNRYGFLGLSTGLDYYYKDNRFFGLQIGGAMDNAVGIPVGVDYFGEIERSNCLFVNATYNHTIGSFEFGYGLNVSRYNWYKADSAIIKEQRKTTALGFNLNSNYRITKNFRVGLLYQPSIFTINNGLKTEYQHLLSVELIFKFRLKRARSSELTAKS
jgi:hypothetical protein